ncbi:serine hydrolase [Bradyrhizobium japonicum]|uniref:Serine hydrolase n=1 Tax=Bradyrhizobium japonicum TaxID=375 RepID=A0A1L3FNT6_BRAJP|nr:serine hydrolase [Bradyrhizobium japonicum]APG14918.1 serine hydrolase [Bradyrhizobium japonicum]
MGVLDSIGLRSPAVVASTEPARLPPGGSSIRWTPEQQIVGYRERHKIDPVRVVGRGPQVAHLPLAIHQISPRWKFKGESMDVDRYMSAQRTAGIIVLKDGKVILERYGLGRAATDGWFVQSVTKSIAAVLIGAAIKDGYIKSVDEPVTKYVPELKASAYDGVNIAQLLSMTSGVNWSEDYNDPQSDVSLAYTSSEAGKPVPELGVNPMISYLRRLPVACPPGVKFNYNSAETELAGILLTNAVGESMSEYLSNKLWQPLGMEKDAYWLVDAVGHERAGGGLCMTLRDHVRIGQFMLGGGQTGNVQVLPPDWLADAISPQAVFPSSVHGAMGYGYFWWIYKDAYAALGHAGQAIVVYPKDKVVIAINSAWPEPNTPEMFEVQEVFIKALHEEAVAHEAGATR